MCCKDGIVFTADSMGVWGFRPCTCAKAEANRQAFYVEMEELARMIEVIEYESASH